MQCLPHVKPFMSGTSTTSLVSFLSNLARASFSDFSMSCHSGEFSKVFWKSFFKVINFLFFNRYRFKFTFFYFYIKNAFRGFSVWKVENQKNSFHFPYLDNAICLPSKIKPFKNAPLSLRVVLVWIVENEKNLGRILYLDNAIF